MAQIMYLSRFVFDRSQYWFDLPPSQIAQQPDPQRGGARLLDVTREPVEDSLIAELPALLDRVAPNAVIVVNDTRVIPARVLATRPTGGGVEVLFVEPEPALGDNVWRCLARARRKLLVGQELLVGDARMTVARARDENDSTIAVAVPGDALAFLDRHGALPLPHYIARPVDDSDKERYQTVFAAQPGAVAAPTAGLHFSHALLERLVAHGHTIAPLTLHVGLGTFTPVRTDDIREHKMHRERFEIPETTAQLVSSGRPVVAIGTTAMRALEAAAVGDHAVAVGPGSTDIFIYPGSGHRFQVVDVLVTNFHLPESTLLMLVSAFGGTEKIRAAYDHAVRSNYRFFSYGDAMLVRRGV